jgi:Zn-dependent protease
MSFSFFILIIYLLILLFSIIIHEVAHGAVADYLGDPTARRQGRLTLNPLPHLDFWGSFVVPVFMLFAFNFAVGWAKPVPYNPYNLDDPKGEAKVSAAGPGSNLLIALFFGIFARLLPLQAGMRADIFNAALSQNWETLGGLMSGSVFAGLFLAFGVIVFLNVLLAFFNLIPVPPLDGSKLLMELLPYEFTTKTKMFLQRYGMLILFALIFLGVLNFVFQAVFLFTSFLLGI